MQVSPRSGCTLYSEVTKEMGVKVTLTVEAGDGRLSFAEAESATYETAKAATEAQIPTDSKAIAIRTP